MEPQGGRRISPFRVTKRSTKLRRLSKTTRSRVHVQTVGLNAETKKCWHRADGGECLLTFPFIGLGRFFVIALRSRTQLVKCRQIAATDWIPLLGGSEIPFKRLAHVLRNTLAVL